MAAAGVRRPRKRPFMSKTLNFPDVVPKLFGEAVYLRELIEDDIPAWFERASDAESADLAGDPIPESVEMGFKWLQRHRERFHQHAGIRWAIVPKDSAESVGTIGLTITSKEERIADLGIVIARAYWCKGIGASAMHLVTGYAFNTLGLAEIQAEVLQRNLASRRLLEKSGFHLVRAIPGNPQLDPISEDCFLYALLRGVNLAKLTFEAR
jgi:[ribosomal protein S5]-alanine N-acetyltransferase